jgi:uncharacterized protein (TIGR03083 family)
MEHTGRMSNLDYPAHIERESERFAVVLAATDPSTRVPSCPDWSAADLLWHLTEVQWFWGTIAAGRLESPETADQDKPERPSEPAAAQALFGTATRRLLDALAGGADDTPVWTWADDQTLGFIRRRQAHEALIHRLDAELSHGEVTSLDPVLSADGVDEMLSVMWGTRAWTTFRPEGGDLLLSTTDTGDVWRVTFGLASGSSPATGTEYVDEPVVAPADLDQAGPPDAEVRAGAAVLDRWLWGRGDLGVERSGDPAAQARLDALIDDGMQ